MTLHEPLVIIGGQIQQLPSGDTINGAVPPAATNLFLVTNNQGSTINVCMAVYVDAANSVKLASANSATLSVFAGLVAGAAIGTGNTGNIQFGEILTATTGQWDAVTGDTGGLVAGTLYFLSPTASGNLTVTAPTVTGKYVVPVGRAINTTNMNVYSRSSILL